MRAPNFMTSNTTWGEVCLDRTISSSGMMWAGLKKWAPIMRSCASVLAATSSMSMVLVLVARMASLRHAFSRSAKICCLILTFSMAASMTRSTESKPLYVRVPVSRPRASAAFASVSSFLRTAAFRLPSMRWMPACRNLSLTSFKMTLMPTVRQAVAIPEPMRPPPSTATVFMGRAFSCPSVMPFTFWVDVRAKKVYTRPLCAGSDAAFANASASASRPTGPPRRRPASTASRYSCGCCSPFACLAACARANSIICIAAPKSSSLSVLCSDDSRGRLFAAMSSASSFAFSRSWVGSAIASTRPSFRACAAPMGLDVSVI
mmetsp:Transcript_695/g.2030  ORF Transcript_695/g.2030 Transcript_695/m.2030 type:complete len:319 (-) Transcript_695:535-1491(-)